VETGREGAPGAAGCRAVVALVEGTETRGVLTKRGCVFLSIGSQVRGSPRGKSTTRWVDRGRSEGTAQIRACIAMPGRWRRDDRELKSRFSRRSIAWLTGWQCGPHEGWSCCSLEGIASLAQGSRDDGPRASHRDATARRQSPLRITMLARGQRHARARPRLSDRERLAGQRGWYRASHEWLRPGHRKAPRAFAKAWDPKRAGFERSLRGQHPGVARGGEASANVIARRRRTHATPRRARRLTHAIES
jgi:hypothetical protein